MEMERKEPVPNL